MLDKITDWINLPEKQFLQLLQTTVAEKGNIGDVFASMVAYNVPNYVLRNLWPERWQEELKSPKSLAFCIAEKGWQGKVQNIKSKVTKIKEKYILTFQKSYVLQADALILCAKLNDALVLTQVPASPDDPGQDWVSRGEADVQFKDSNGNSYDHFFVEGEMALAEQYMQELSIKTYARIGLEIPRREFTSLAVVATGVLKYHNAHDVKLNKHLENIFNEREAGRIKASLNDASAIIKYFFEKVENEKLEVHPFWFRAKKMFSALTERLER